MPKKLLIIVRKVTDSWLKNRFSKNVFREIEHGVLRSNRSNVTKIQIHWIGEREIVYANQREKLAAWKRS